VQTEAPQQRIPPWPIGLNQQARAGFEMHRSHSIGDHPPHCTADGLQALSIENLLHDPLIRLVMDSDGVTEDSILALIDEVRSASGRRRQRIAHRQLCGDE
jgi:hypothetical protein